MRTLALALLAFALLTGSAFAAEELTEVQTVSPLMDQILVWLGAAAVIAGTLATVLPKHWAFTQLLARFATDLRAVRKPDPAKTTKPPPAPPDHQWPPPPTLLVLLALPLSGCAFWSDTVVPVVAECAPDKTYVIQGLSDILQGKDAFDVLDELKREKGPELVLCALQRFLERVTATPDNANERATARAYLEKHK